MASLPDLEVVMMEQPYTGRSLELPDMDEASEVPMSTQQVVFWTQQNEQLSRIAAALEQIEMLIREEVESHNLAAKAGVEFEPYREGGLIKK